MGSCNKKIQDNIERVQEREALRDMLMEPQPRNGVTIFEDDGSSKSPPSPIQWTNEQVDSYAAHQRTPDRTIRRVRPDTPRKPRADPSDEIIETAMHLMDLCMEQKRHIVNLEKRWKWEAFH